MNEELKELFTPFNIGKVTIKNRFIMGPMGTATLQTQDNILSQNIVEYFFERARGGFGMITMGMQLTDTKVDAFNPVVSRSPMLNPLNFKRTAERMIERCDAYNTKMFAQIAMGGGRHSNGGLTPSPLPNFYNPSITTTEYTKEQIKQKIEMMVKGAELMRSSGFHGVELHSIHWGYLLDQFVMAYTNHREDEYGGSLDNRLRVVKEIVDGIHETCGSDFPITVRLGVKGFMKGWHQASLTGEEEVGRTIEEGVEICRKLEAMGLDALSVDTGTYDSFYYACPPSYLPRGYALDLYKQCKDAVNIPILAGSRMGDPYLCAKALKEGKADAFVLSRPSLADPDFPRKIEQGTPEKIRPCIGCGMCIGRVADKYLLPACAVNPRATREIEYLAPRPTSPKKIMVVGGGVAGMAAARLAAQFGHQVELYEKSDTLGGELHAAGKRPLKTEVAELNDWYQRELKELNVPIHMNTSVNADMVRAAKPDVAILAVGASPVMPKSIPGINHEKSVSSVDAMTGKRPVGQKVVVVGGGEIGCEVAMDLILHGKEVSMVEALPGLMSVEFVPRPHKEMLIDMLKHYKVPVYTNSRLLAINDEGAVITGPDGNEKTLTADTVVLSIGMRSNPSFASELVGEGIEIYEIGSGKKVSNIYSAIHNANDILYNL